MKLSLAGPSALATTTAAGALTALGWSPAAAQPYNWTGCYVGGNVGGLWADIDQSVRIPPPANFYYQSGGTDSGFTGGAQAGCNWQGSPTWVLGVEGDLNFASAKRSQGFAFTYSGEDTVGSQETKLRWLATLRGRFGATWNATLFYVTGGAAFGGVKSQVSAVVDSPATFFGSYSDTRIGWTLGGGVEHRFSERWSAKLEYLHFDLGSFDYLVTRVSGVTVVPSPWYANGSVSGDIVRVGVNYQFTPLR